MADNQVKQSVKEVKAFARYIHVSPRKLRLVANLIKRSPVDVALEQLRFSSKNAAVPLAKAINSAISNAVHNFDLNRDDLFVKAVTIDGGPVYKSYSPRAQGRAFIVRKRTSHINVVLEAKTRSSKPKRSVFTKLATTKRAETKAGKNENESGKTDTTKTGPRQAPKSEQKIKQNKVDNKRRLFNRKSGE